MATEGGAMMETVTFTGDAWILTDRAGIGNDRLELWHIAGHLRSDDKREFDALIGKSDQRAIYDRIVWLDQLLIEAYSVGQLDEPIAYIGCWRTGPTTASAGFFATDSFPKIALDLSRWIRRVWIPHLIDLGLRRVEVRSLANARDNCKWLEVLGARHECDVEQLGLAGETFRQYAFLKGEVECACRPQRREAR